MKTQTKNNELNFNMFTDALSELNLDYRKNDVKEADCSTLEVKKLTVDIMDLVASSHNTALMNCIAKKVEDWCNDKTANWKKTLLEYARSQTDIEGVYCGSGEQEHEFAIVTSSMESDLILQHNDFCFELFDRYEDISEFMVLYRDEFTCMSEYYDKFSKIY